MAANDIRYWKSKRSLGNAGNFVEQTQANTTVINYGEPVAKALGAQYATALATSKPVVGTDYIAGVATVTGSQTTTADGTVTFFPMDHNDVYLCAAKTAATWNTQAKYNALVGARVTLDLTNGVYTVNATDSANNGLVVEPLTITQAPGFVAFSFRDALNYLS